MIVNSFFSCWMWEHGCGSSKELTFIPLLKDHSILVILFGNQTDAILKLMVLSVLRGLMSLSFRSLSDHDGVRVLEKRKTERHGCLRSFLP